MVKGTIIIVWALAAALMAAVALDVGRTWWSSANAAVYPACPPPAVGVACG